jgi:hypothetical protein
MKGKTFVKLLVIFSFLILFFASDIAEKPVTGQQCENTAETNKAIVDNIYKEIKADKNLAPQISHLNITATNLVVKIEGWADSQKDYDKIQSIALKTNCVKAVNVNKLNSQKPPENTLILGCSGGTKKCGDICIPENDICNISGGEF